jgi:hypothetical protein
MADVAILHVPSQREAGDETVPGAGIQWTPPDLDLLYRVLAGLQRL